MYVSLPINNVGLQSYTNKCDVHNIISFMKDVKSLAS